MEEGIPCKQVAVSDEFDNSVDRIYAYGLETFGYFQAERYDRQILQSIATLSTYYTFYPECQHLATLSRMYRNIILNSHLIIYRITTARIEVLDIVHAASSIRRIRNVRKIKLKT